MRRLGRVTVSAITLAGLMVLPATAQGADCIVIVPVGERLSSNAGLTQVRVLRSGPDPGGAWQDERVNALADAMRKPLAKARRSRAMNSSGGT